MTEVGSPNSVIYTFYVGLYCLDCSVNHKSVGG